MPTRIPIQPKHVDFPVPSQEREEREVFRQYYNEKQAAEYKRRKEGYKNERVKKDL